MDLLIKISNILEISIDFILFGDLINPEDESIRNTLRILHQLSPAGKRAMNNIALEIEKLEKGHTD